MAYLNLQMALECQHDKRIVQRTLTHSTPNLHCFQEGVIS